MNDLLSHYNPSFMNPMLESARPLITRLHNVFGDGKGNSTALTRDEAQALQSKYPDDLGQMKVDQIVGASVYPINRLYDCSIPSDRKFDQVISGQKIELTEQALADIHCQGIRDVKAWLEREHGFTEDQISTINFSEFYSSLRTLAQESGIDVNSGFIRQACDVFYQPLISVDLTPENSRTIHLGAEERHQIAKGEIQILFIVAREFITPSYGAALIEARDLQLAQDMKEFFRTFPRQLGQVRNPDIMSDDTFAKLTAER